MFPISQSTYFEYHNPTTFMIVTNVCPSVVTIAVLCDSYNYYRGTKTVRIVRRPQKLLTVTGKFIFTTISWFHCLTLKRGLHVIIKRPVLTNISWIANLFFCWKMVKLFCIVLFLEVHNILGEFNFSNIFGPGYDPATLPAGPVNVKVFCKSYQLYYSIGKYLG